MRKVLGATATLPKVCILGRECKPIVARTDAPNLFRRMVQCRVAARQTDESGLNVCFSFWVFLILSKVRSRFAAPPYHQLSPASVRRCFASMPSVHVIEKCHALGDLRAAFAQTSSQELRDGLTLEGQEQNDGSSTKMRLLSTNSSYQRKKFGWNQERLMSYGICHFLFGCCFFLVSLACVSPSWLPCLIRRVAPNPRIQRSEFVNSYQQQPVCCLVFFFLYSESRT